VLKYSKSSFSRTSMYLLPRHELHLSTAGYEFKQLPGLTKGTLILTVETDRMNDLAVTLKTANTEAANKRRLN